MNKFAQSILAASVLAASGTVPAQDGGAECQGAASSGGGPGCGAGPSGVPYPNAPTAGVPVTPQAGTYPTPYGYRDFAYGPQRQAYPVYPITRPSRRDRDGDGVPNRGDRYPHDPYRY